MGNLLRSLRMIVLPSAHAYACRSVVAAAAPYSKGVARPTGTFWRLGEVAFSRKSLPYLDLARRYVDYCLFLSTVKRQAESGIRINVITGSRRSVEHEREGVGASILSLTTVYYRGMPHLRVEAFHWLPATYLARRTEKRNHLLRKGLGSAGAQNNSMRALQV